MTKQQLLNLAIERVASIKEVSKWEISSKLMQKDDWTWTLVFEAEKAIKAEHAA